jgi:hypothetical protein
VATSEPGEAVKHHLSICRSGTSRPGQRSGDEPSEADRQMPMARAGEMVIQRRQRDADQQPGQEFGQGRALASIFRDLGLIA